MTKILGIPGTWSWAGDEHDFRDHWWHPQSPFMAFLAEQGFAHLCPEEPFIWTTSLNGAAFWRSNHLDWQAGGAALVYYLATPGAVGPEAETPVEDRNLIAHSHGLQVVLYACAYRNLQVNRLVSVASPVRKDMLPIAKAARRNIRQWYHIYTNWSDKVQWLGEWFDGRLGVARRHPFADMNCMAPGVGHSGLFHKHKGLWVENGWTDWLKES